MDMILPGNRTSEQVDMGVTTASFNNLNQLTGRSAGEPIRFAGHLNETGTVWVAGSPAQMGIQGTSFVGFAQDRGQSTAASYCYGA